MRIVVLAGPPCSGKTTLAHTLAQPDDHVLDYDEIARAMGSPARWIHPEPYLTEAEHEMQVRIAGLHTWSTDSTAWVIRSAPRAFQRLQLAHAWDAEVYVLLPAEAECRRRAAEDGRPSGTGRRIGEWYHRYRPWVGDRDPSSLDASWLATTRVDRGEVALDPHSI